MSVVGWGLNPRQDMLQRCLRHCFIKADRAAIGLFLDVDLAVAIDSTAADRDPAADDVFKMKATAILTKPTTTNTPFMIQLFSGSWTIKS